MQYDVLLKVRILLVEVGGGSKWAVLRQRRTSEGGALRSIFKIG
jgi:hypothetical protein